MSENQNQKEAAADETPVQKVTVNYADNCDYKYRDVLNIFVGRGDVILELGNIHRSVVGQATISDRVAVSMATAFDFHARLGQALKEAQEALQKEIAQSR